MKEKIKRISSSTWALILALMMVVSSFSVLAATTNVEKTSAFNGTVYFKCDGYTGDVCIYTWNSSDKPGLGSWPGTKMTKVKDGLYSLALENHNFPNVIFNNNNNGVQTGNLEFPTDGKNMYVATYNTTNKHFDPASSKDDSWSTYSASKDPVATSVSLTSNATDGEIAKGTDLKLTATATGKVDGDVTYTFYNGNTQVGDAQTTSASTATTTVSNLSSGDYTFTVKVTKDGYTEVSSDPINVTVTGGSGGSVSDDIISVLNGDKIMFYIGNRWGQGTENIYTTDSSNPIASVSFTAKDGEDSCGAVTAPPAQYFVTHEVGKWVGVQMSSAAQAGYRYITYNSSGDKIAVTESTGSATTTISDKNVVSTDFTAGKSGTGTAYTLVYYMKDSSGDYSQVGTSADEVNTKIASLSDGTYTLYTCSTDGTITVLRDTDEFSITSPVATSVTISADATSKSVGDSVGLTANATGLASGASNVKYTFTEVKEDGTTVGTPQELSTNTATFTNLTKGTHYYNVTVSADGYSSVTGEKVKVEVSQVKVADSVTLTPATQEINVGETAKLTAKATNPVSGELTYTLYEGSTKVTDKSSSTGSVDFSISDYTEVKEHTYTVTVSMPNDDISKYVDVTSDEATVNVVKHDVATITDFTADKSSYNTGDDVTLTAKVDTTLSGDLTYTFSETTEGAQTEDVVVTNSDSEAKATFKNLTEGTHTYKVVVSKTNYTSVEKTISIDVSTPDVATSVSISATPSEIYIGETSTLTAVAVGKSADRVVTYTFYQVNADDSKKEIGKVENTTETNASLQVTGNEKGTFNYSVTVSATNCNSVSSKDNATVTVSKKASATNVSLTGVTDGSTVYVGDKVTLNVTCDATEGASVKYNYYLGDTLLNSTPTTETSLEYTLKAGDVGDKVFKVEVVADNYETVSSNEIKVTVAKKDVANAVTISTSDTEVANNSSFTLTAKVDTPATENLTYKFIETSGAVEAQSGNSSSQEFKITKNGTYTFKVEVSADGFNTVTSTNTVQVKVVDPPKDLYLIGDFDGTAHWTNPSSYKDYKFEYKNGKYILNNVPFTGSQNGKSTLSYFRIYESDTVQYSSTTDNKDQDLSDGVQTQIRKYTNNALTFPAEADQLVNIELDLSNENKPLVTVTVVREEHNVTAKYQTTDDGVTYTTEKADTSIVTVDGAESSTTSSGEVVAKDTIAIGSSTYVFAGWKSENGKFTDATKASTKFRPSSDAVAIAQYKRQYTVSATTTGGNGSINVAKGPYLAGDTVTVNIVPNTGYQLASLKRTTGVSGETTDVKAGVSDNKYVVSAITSDEKFVATFEKIPLDYSKYRVVGHFDDNQTWSFTDGCKFDTNGKATFTIAQPTSGGNGQFRIDWNDGSTTITYGCGENDVKKVEDGVTYTPVKNNGKPYYVPYEGTYVVEIVDIDSNGVPKFKVTKDDTISKYQLYISKGRNAEGTNLGNFTKVDDGVYQYLLNVDAGTHYFYIKDSTSTESNLQYSDGRENCVLGTSYHMTKRNNVENMQYKLSAGLYKVTYSNFENDGSGYMQIDSVSKPLADSVSLKAKNTAVEKGKSTTLTATVNGTKLSDSESYTYTFYDEKNNVIGKPVTTTSKTATCEVTSATVATKSYKVVVSTNATYEDPDYPDTTLTYTDVSSETIQVDFRDKIYYIAKVVDGKIGQRNALTQDSFKPADSSVTELTVALFTDETEISEDTIVNLDLNSSKNKYTTVTSSTLDDGTVSGGIPTYTIKCNEGTGDLTIYVRDNQIYATASLKDATSKTFDSTDTVDYYFAEPTANTDISNPTSGDGLRIYYWNNSVAEQNGYADVTTAVDENGTKVTTGDENTITVNMTDLYSSGVKGTKTFYVYKVSLPVWATSFKFVSSGTTTFYTKNTFAPNGVNGEASIGLNPNRIYLLYGENYVNYCRGVVLDQSFWTNTSRDNNDVQTKNFKANAVNYNTIYNSSGNVTNSFNTSLNSLYSSSYSNPLFFGYMTQSPVSNTNFRIQDNLAMRHDGNHAYYASVQGLAGGTLSTTSKNANGYGYLLTADGSANMPLFDYDKLKNNTGVASNVFEKMNFPFNESSYNGITTYSYDSFTDKNRAIDKSTGDFKVSNYSNATIGSDKGVGYFPFENYNGKQYGFGTEFDIDFYMSDTGKLTAADGTQKDITFNFSGDDDVWVYVDGVLVLDLGGAHKVSSGSINFSDMNVIYKAAVDTSDNINSRGQGTGDKFATDADYVTTVDLAKLFAANGVEFNNKNTSKKHTLQMFYMERGSFDSNCSISFNLPQNTGLLVRNDVNFDGVNAGLKDVTMGVANKDYFSYSIGNKLASDSDSKTLKDYFGSDIIADPAQEGSFSDSNFKEEDPLYPIKTSNNVIRRVVNGKTYYLAVKNDGTDSLGSTYYWDDLTSDAYLPLSDINYRLPDDFAQVENKADSNDANSGVTTVSGQVNDGVFNLLFNQSASFNSKTPSNTLLQIAQNDSLYCVDPGDSSTAMSAVDSEAEKPRTVSDYYQTAYTITDDKSQKVIGSREKKFNNAESDVTACDASGLDGFYFADYSGNKSESSAMTVNFTNYVDTSDIKITKSLTDESDINNDHFTFVVKLSNIFGDTSDSVKKEYEGLTYNIYDKDTDELKSTRTYGKSGVSITANEYAVITGVPAGTSYEIYEKSRTGYKFDSVTATYDGNSEIDTYGEGKGDDDRDVTYVGPDVNGATVTGSLKLIADKNNDATPLVLDYINEKSTFTISFKYYDRQVTTGQVAHISTTPTVVNYSFNDISGYRTGEDESGNPIYNYKQMITDAAVNSGVNPSNVIDSYKYYTSQAEAVAGIKDESSYRNYDSTSSKYLTYGEAYADGNFANHTDCYGRLQGSDGAKVSDGEDWVSYYNGNTKYATESEAEKGDTPVTSITVWFFNNLKTYSPTFSYATQSSELNPIDGNKYVGTQLNDSIKTFYNVRLGVANVDEAIDGEGVYLKEYGVTGFIGTYSGTAMTIQNGDKELQFLYWSYDVNGKTIASNSYKYGYRVTNDIHLYAIYGDAKDKKDPGLTVTKNDPDYYVDNGGVKRVRLNTMMNVYNCPDSDKNIKQVSVIYLQDPNDYIGQYIADNNTTALESIRESVYELIVEQSKNANFSNVIISIDGENDNYAKGLTYDVWSGDSSILTNKNRIQFTTSFKQDLLGGDKYKNLYTFAAMNYSKDDSTDWIVSDNCIKYVFDENGKVTEDSTQVNSLQ